MGYFLGPIGVVPSPPGHRDAAEADQGACAAGEPRSGERLRGEYEVLRNLEIVPSAARTGAWALGQAPHSECGDDGINAVGRLYAALRLTERAATAPRAALSMSS